MDKSCLIAVAGLSLLASCTPHASHQRPWPEVRVDGQASVASVAVVELDEHGDFWDTNQLRQSLQLIRRTPKPLLVTFIHGWRHDARSHDSDLREFKEFIDELNRKKPAGYTACGLYVGWRGASVDEQTKALSYLPAVGSFWNRKRATDRVADIGLCRVLNQTAAYAWQRDGRVVAIGHSFGGRILERVVGMSAASQAGRDSMTPLADLTILINPASESLTARKLKLALQQWKKPYPLIVAMGAKDDKATGVAWKWSYRFAPQPPTRQYQVRGKDENQRRFLDVTVTNDPRQLTHDLLRDEAGGKVPAKDTVAFNLSGLDARHTPFYLRLDPGRPPVPYRLHERDPRRVEGVGYVIDSDAYWSFQLPREVISGHGGDHATRGIFSDPMTDLMCGILGKADLRDRADGGPKVTPHAGPLKMEPSASSDARRSFQ